jgi:hypothetical protein
VSVTITLDNALSGALGALAVVLIEQISSNQSQHREDLIGSIILAHKLQANVNSLETFHNVVISDLNAQLKAYRPDSQKANFRDLGFIEALLCSPLGTDRSITLKHQSFGCFYVASAHDRGLVFLGEALRYLKSVGAEYDKLFSSTANAEEKMQLNVDYAASLTEGISVIRKIILRLFEDIDKLLKMISESIYRLSSHQILRMFVYWRRAADVKNLEVIAAEASLRTKNAIDIIKPLVLREG